MDTLPATFAAAAPDLLPVLRAARRLDPSVLQRAHTHGVVEAVVWDTPTLRHFVPAGAPERWQVPADAVFTEAEGNLYPEEGLRLRDDGLWEVATGDGYESSRLALPGWLAAFADRVQGRPLAAIPHARALLVGGTGNRGLVERLLDRAEAAWRSEGDPISPIPVTVDATGRVVDWTPEDATLRERLVELRTALG